LGFAEIMQHEYGDLPPESMEHFLATILRNGRKMQDIIEGLLLLANVRQETIALSPLAMAPLLAEAKARLAPLIDQHHAEIAAPGHLPEAIGYLPWVEEVWVNLLSNAIKYGGRPPRVEVSGRVEANGMAVFFVQDNGRGLTPAEQEKLFVPFSRLPADSQMEGHGLGLSIVERIVTKLGGTIRVMSSPGEGSTFCFSLPTSDLEVTAVSSPPSA